MHCLRPWLTHRLLRVLALVLAGATLLGADLPFQPRFVVIAHRGDHTAAHENSLEAITNAIRIGADYVELDVRQAKDGEHILMHDATVTRTTGHPGVVADMTWQELGQLRLRDTNRPSIPPALIPTLDQALALIRGKIRLYLDFKAGDRARVAGALARHGLERSTVIYDGWNNARLWKELNPSLRLICSPASEDLAPERLSILRKASGVEILDGPFSRYTKANVRLAHRSGWIIWADIQGPAESPPLWAVAVGSGLDGLMTDKPAELVAYLRRTGHRR